MNTPDDAPVNASLVERVLAARGLRDKDVVDRFCQPSLQDLHDPGLLPGVDAAAERIIDAVRGRRSIVIYGDYDVDGMTATAILYHMLKALDPEARVSTYVPHRIDEGYGINTDALRQLRTDGADLVVSVDCGVTAVEPARVAHEIGLELIITDHHRPDGDDLPVDTILVHPALEDSTYPFADLAGAGVAFKLAWRIATMRQNSENVGESFRRLLVCDLLPLAALGTIADVVPLVDENRIIARHGLAFIGRTSLPGVRALLELTRLTNAQLDTEDVGFKLAPILNACGRLGKGKDAVDLLTVATPEKSHELAGSFHDLNEQRKRMQAEITDQAAEMAEAAGMTGPESRAIVLAHENWHPGVIGIVCSRLVDRYSRPTILMQIKDGMCRGSARSIDGYSIHDGLIACSEHLENYGGHAMAAGLTLDADRLEDFTNAFRRHAAEQIGDAELTALLPIDCDASLGDLDEAGVRRLSELGPFGRSNRRPVVRLRGLRLAAPPQRLGAKSAHLALRLDTGETNGKTIRAVWWSAGDIADKLGAGMHLDLAVEPKLSSFRGRVSVEPEIRDVILRPV